MKLERQHQGSKVYVMVFMNGRDDWLFCFHDKCATITPQSRAQLSREKKRRSRRQEVTRRRTETTSASHLQFGSRALADVIASRAEQVGLVADGTSAGERLL